MFCFSFLFSRVVCFFKLGDVWCVAERVMINRGSWVKWGVPAWRPGPLPGWAVLAGKSGTLGCLLRTATQTPKDPTKESYLGTLLSFKGYHKRDIFSKFSADHRRPTPDMSGIPQP